MSAILDAFARAQAATRALHDLPGQATDEDCQPFHSAIDDAQESMVANVATSFSEHAAKLRVAMTGIDQSLDANRLFYGLVDLMDEPTEPYDGGLFETLVWDTIRDLESQAVVAAEPFRRWEDLFATFDRTRSIWRRYAKAHQVAEAAFFTRRTPETEALESSTDQASTAWCRRDAEALRTLLAFPAPTYEIALYKFYLASEEGEPIEKHRAEVQALSPKREGEAA